MSSTFAHDANSLSSAKQNSPTAAEAVDFSAVESRPGPPHSSSHRRTNHHIASLPSRRGQGDERGDTLIEILFAIVIIGLVVGALFSAFTTAAQASAGNNNLVTADALLRDYAEATKAAVRTSCPTSSTFTTTISTPPGFTVTANTNQCPASATTTQQVNITVQMPQTSLTRTLSILVRQP